MSLVWADRTLETTVGNGTGPFVLAGAVAGYNAFSDGFSVADTCYGTIFAVDADGRPTGDWVTGLLTYSAANQITVTTVSKSSNVDAAVEFTPGTKWVMACPIGDNIEDWQTAVTDALTAADIGVSVQAYSANLTEYAAVNPTAAGLALLDDADNSAQRDTLEVYSAAEVDAAIAAAAGGDSSAASGVVSGLGVAYSGTGLTFNMSAGTAKINGDLITAAAQSVILSAADATNPRIDVFYVDDAGAFGKITGTPAVNPSQPTVDPTSQLYLGFALVPATATDLTSGITTETIYDEGVEWTATSSGSGFTVDSTNNPNTGTKCIEGTAVAAAAYVKFVDGSPTTFDSSGNLILSIRSKAVWNSKRSLLIQWYASGVAKGSPVTIKAEGTYGFTSANISTYQTLNIPKTAFAVPAGTTADELRITAAGSGGSAIGLYLDTIKTQTVAAGSGGGGTTTGISQTEADARYLKLTGGTLTGDLIVPAEAYGVSWNGSNEAPTKNDVYDKIETVVAAGATRASLGLDTTDSPQFAALNIGAASDTTLARSGVGDLTVEGNAIYRAGGTDVPLADGGTGASLADPNADRILFWDDSAGAMTWLTAGTNLTITGTTIDAASTSGSGTRASGVAFPGSPASGDLFYRTDRKIEYYYDGTRWLSLGQFRADMETNNQSASFNGLSLCLNTHNVQLYVESVYHRIVITGTGNWTVWVRDDGGNVISQLTNQAATANTLSAVNAVTTGTPIFFAMQGTENSGTATASYFASVLFRLVG